MSAEHTEADPTFSAFQVEIDCFIAELRSGVVPHDVVVARRWTRVREQAELIERQNATPAGIDA